MTGILLIQLGTPDAPTPSALKTYLRQFLSDRRVIELPRLPWWLLLNLYILQTRPRQSAAKYARIWDPVTGSPLLHYTKRQTELLQEQFPNVPVRFGMMIGNPPVADVVGKMIREGVDRLLVFPMFPQYSATTFAAATDVLFKALMKERRVPAVRVVPPYYSHPGYLDAFATIVREELKRLPWEPDHYVYSFHGIPQSYSKQGDYYATHVVRTTRFLQERLAFPKGKWTQTYQSLFGRSEWLRPYTDDTLTELSKQGKKKVFVMVPGFTADCLETIDEIGHESKEHFLAVGGEALHQCRCLNDHPAWIAGMKAILADEGRGWLPETEHAPDGQPDSATASPVA